MNPSEKIANKEKRLYLIIQSGFKIIGKLPRNIAEFISVGIGQLGFLLDKRHRMITLTNLTHAYGNTMTEREIRCLAKKVFANLIMVVFRIGWSMNINLSDFNRWFIIRGEEHLTSAIKKRRGILFLTGHLGSWELLPFFFGHTGLAQKGASVYKPLKSPAIEKFITDIRQRFGGHMYPMKRALKHIKKTLDNDGCAILLMDQSTRARRGAVIDFFGRRTYGNNGMARLALQSRSPVLPLFLVREQDKYVVIIEPEIPLTFTDNEPEDIKINTQKYNRAIEAAVNKYPDQYFWLHNRWKHTPPL